MDEQSGKFYKLTLLYPTEFVGLLRSKYAYNGRIVISQGNIVSLLFVSRLTDNRFFIFFPSLKFLYPYLTDKGAPFFNTHRPQHWLCEMNWVLHKVMSPEPQELLLRQHQL